MAPMAFASTASIAYDRSGCSVAGAGDVNGDGFDDLIIGAPAADRRRRSHAGESYVVFGRASGFGASLDLATLDGTNGFRLDGIDAYDYSGAPSPRPGTSTATASTISSSALPTPTPAVITSPARATSCSAATSPAR